MDRLPTRVNKADPDYSTRREHNLALIETLRERLDLVHQGGGEKYVERRQNRNKMLARERIERIIDPGTAFLDFPRVHTTFTMVVPTQLESSQVLAVCMGERSFSFQ